MLVEARACGCIDGICLHLLRPDAFEQGKGPGVVREQGFDDLGPQRGSTLVPVGQQKLRGILGLQTRDQRQQRHGIGGSSLPETAQHARNFVTKSPVIREHPQFVQGRLVASLPNHLRCPCEKALCFRDSRLNSGRFELCGEFRERKILLFNHTQHLRKIQFGFKHRHQRLNGPLVLDAQRTTEKRTDHSIVPRLLPFQVLLTDSRQMRQNGTQCGPM